MFKLRKMARSMKPKMFWAKHSYFLLEEFVCGIKCFLLLWMGPIKQ
jgi:hypothetical protein